MTHQTLNDLSKAKAVFQQRAILAVLGVTMGEADSTYVQGLAKESGNAASPANNTQHGAGV